MRIGKWFLKLGMVFLLGPILFGMIWIWPEKPLPFAEVKASYRPSDSWILAKDGTPLELIRTGKEYRSLAWVNREELSPHFVRLLKEAEDKRFDSHKGVDFFALGRVFYAAVTGQRVTGASTLSMQLTSILARPFGNRRERSLYQKISQILGAFRLEKNWTKAQILEAYVNLVSFRGELVGLRAASFGYFQKNPSGLLEEEAALLIALLRSPNAKAQKVGERACRLLKRLECQAILLKAEEALGSPYRVMRARELVPVLADEFLKPSPRDPKSRAEGWLETSLDAKIQKLAQEALHEQLAALKDQNVKDGAVLVLSTQSGEVLAYVANGGSGFSSAPQIDGIKMRRQAGSTIKPIVYAQAFEDKLLDPRSLLEDTPLEIGLAGGKVYRPRNYDYKFRGLVSAGEALGSSLNVPAVRALSLVGEGKTLSLMKQLGFQNLASEGYYGHSLALGTIDVSLWELTGAYRQFGANSSFLSKQTQEALFQVLAAPEYRRLTFGLDSVLVLPFASAVKTGTSQDMRDNWCIGWNEDYTVGVWVGNFDGKPMWHVSGVSGAAPVWRSVMESLVPQNPRPIPSYLPPEEPLEKKILTRIRYPVADMLVALDPDIPYDQQKMPIEVENPQPKNMIYLNGKALAQASELHLWTIQRGSYDLELRNKEGQALDKVRFEVR